MSEKYTRESEVFEAGGNLSTGALQHYAVFSGKGFCQDWGIRDVSSACHRQAKAAGWWHDPHTGEMREADVPRCLMLIVSEVAEAMEGHRKSLMDDHLPHRQMTEVELADAVIRIFDLAERLGMDVPGAMLEKLKYNESRPDHKPENRRVDGGKKY